jgi:hypothetical protein
VTTDLEVYEAPQAPSTLFGTDDPGEVVARATAAARPLAEVVNKQHLFATIQGRKHVLVEGWCLLGSMLGVFPVTTWTRKTETGWEARCEARTKDGAVVGAAEASCDRTEKTWATRDDYALRSMAQTRATSKALRQPLGFVMTLAGYAATPAEEMPREEVVEEAIVSPAGEPFPDQREPHPTQFVPPDGATSDLATEGQLKNIGRLMGVLIKQDESGQVSRESLKAEIQLAYGVTSSKELRKRAASEVIDGFKRRAGEE